MNAMNATGDGRTPIRLAIIHYHLRTGGVTTVIDHACESLGDHHVSACVLVGEAGDRADGFRVPVRVVEGLGYDDDRAPADDATLAERLMDSAAQALGGRPDIWHVHNHSLGKNVALPAALHRMAQADERIVFQIHDFAEDGRPGNYQRLREHLVQNDDATLGTRLYPHASHIQYAALNSRDHDHLLAAGLPKDRLHLLPNAIKPFPDEDAAGPSTNQRASKGRRFVYPTRAIRRKNLGEVLLWAALASLDDTGDEFAVTRAPKNPQQRPAYDRWVALAAELNLPVTFEAGEEPGIRYPDLLRQADALITTSIAEGFGMIFLEPWLAGRALVGRNLPDITRSIAQRGIRLDGLYDRLLVPEDWLDRDQLTAAVREALNETYHAYGLDCPDDLVEQTLAQMTCDSRVDFGRLDEPLQEAIIRRVIASPEDRADLRPSALTATEFTNADDIAHNRAITREAFGLDAYGQTLRKLYDRLLAASPGSLDSLDARAVLDRFLAPEQFNLLRT